MQKNRSYFLVTVLLVVILSTSLAFLFPKFVQAEKEPVKKYPVMHVDLKTRKEWIKLFNLAPKAYIEKKIFKVPTKAGYKNLLEYLEYIPAERDQGVCGNCWVWAGTGVMEIAMSVRESIKDRLSIQYLNSNYIDACCGGWLHDLVVFYAGTGKAIPWSNTNANWQDGNVSCGGDTNVPPETISTVPRYPIGSIIDKSIPTHGVGKEIAISTIKNIIDQNKAIWFTFFLPDSESWDNFFYFWGNGSEDDIWNPDFVDGKPWVDGEGAGHAVLCVGYDDTDPNNKYWIMVNSWGITEGRSNGIFHVDMDINYDNNDGYFYNLYWQTLDIEFGFLDVPSTHWAHDYIWFLAFNGIVSGYGDGTYGPENPLKRSQFTKIIVESMLNQGIISSIDDYIPGTFPDVDSSHWAADYIMTAFNNGVISEKGDGTFDPEGLARRSHIVKMVIEAFDIPIISYIPGTFTDVSSSYWAADYIMTAKENEIVSGYTEDNTFRPENNATRAQIAKIIYNSLGP